MARALDAHGYQTHEFGDFVWLDWSARTVGAVVSTAPAGRQGKSQDMAV